MSRYRLRPAPRHAARLKPKLDEQDRANLTEGRLLFNAGRYWQAHEAWELIWQRHTEPWRSFVQGLIQVAAAFHQLRRGVRHGAIKHLRNALAKLDVAPGDFAGLALVTFRANLHDLLEHLETAGDEDFQMCALPKLYEALQSRDSSS